MSLIIAFICFLVIIRPTIAELRIGGKNVCSYEVAAYGLKNLTEIGCKVVKTTSKTCENVFCWSKVDKTVKRQVSYIMYRMSLVALRKRVAHCCEGWRISQPGADECTQPTCKIPCVNGGQCTRLGRCQCKSGFDGAYCQNDVNECQDPNLNKCSHNCENNIGSFKCSCKKGYVLAGDNTTCKDIDECSMGSCRCVAGSAKCVADCQNTIGSFVCRCNAGYEQKIPGTCQDRDECLENSNICDYKCVNIDGGYKCECPAGYTFNKTINRCKDINECLENQGGCSHTCKNTLGSMVCLCPAGYELLPDRKTCKVITF